MDQHAQRIFILFHSPVRLAPSTNKQKQSFFYFREENNDDFDVVATYVYIM